MTTIGIIYSFIQVVLKAFSLWDSFLDYSDNQRAIEAAKKKEALGKAVDDSTTAETEDEIWKSQNDITRNLP